MASFNEWKKSKSVDDLIKCNIKSLDGTIDNPIMWSDGTPILYEDTLPYMETIKQINQNGFITLCSQPTSYDYCFSDKPYHREQCYKTILDRPLFDMIEGKYFTELLQKGYCEGYIKYDMLKKFSDKIKNMGYDIYYYSNYHKLDCDTEQRINVTHAFNGMVRYEMTNVHLVKENDDNSYYHIKKALSKEMAKKIRIECVFICVIDKEFGSKLSEPKNIYGDILSCLI